MAFTFKQWLRKISIETNILKEPNYISEILEQ